MRALIPLLMLLSSALAAQTTLPSAPHVYVQGIGHVEVDPDVLKISGTITVNALDAATAEGEVQEKSARLLAVAHDRGIDADDIQASTVSVSPTFAYNAGETRFTGYAVRREFEIAVGGLENYYATVQAFVESATLDYVNVLFSYSEIDTAVRDAQLAAIDDARQRAESLAERAGARLGSVYSISEFDLRQEEEFLLKPSRSFYESELGDSETVVVTGARIADFSSARGTQLFQGDSVSASAEVYVVYNLEFDR